MAVFERDILQAVEFIAQHYPGVVVVLNDDKRVVFVGGIEARILSGLISSGDFLSSSKMYSSGFEEFLNTVVHSESTFSGYYESKVSGVSEVLWNGNYLESGIIILKGKVVRGNTGSFSEPDNELDALRAKERIFSTLLSNLPGMVYRCKNDVDWSLDFVSEGCLELTGYEVEALLGNRDIAYADLILPEFRAYVWECVQEAIQDNEPYEIMYKIRTLSGELKWVWEKGVDVYEDGEFIGLEGFITDVTLLMETEQALHQSEERYRLMAEKTGQMVYDLNLNTNEIIWAGAVREISGCTEEEFQSVDLDGWEKLIHPDDREHVVADLEKSLKRACSFVSTYRFRRKDGSFLYVEDEGDFLLDVTGKPIRMIGAIKNYSDKMKVQELMIQSEKMTTVASLSAGMAHEINNPLGVISQSAQNIERRLLPHLAKNKEVADKIGVPIALIRQYLDERNVTTMLDSIKEASSRVARTIVNMLNFSRKSGEDKKNCNLKELLEQALEKVKTDLNSCAEYEFSRVNIIKNIQPDLPEILCFGAEIERVFFQLVKNSAQIICSNKSVIEEPTIKIKLFSNDAYLTIEIEDNGPGMDAITRKKVFEPFFTTRINQKGSGLGLSIVYFIITHNHGGAIRLDSEPGEGSKFTISLPRGPVADLYSNGSW